MKMNKFVPARIKKEVAKIEEFCKSHTGCEDCKMHTDGDNNRFGCGITDCYPYEWFEDLKEKAFKRTGLTQEELLNVEFAINKVLSHIEDDRRFFGKNFLNKKEDEFKAILEKLRQS